MYINARFCLLSGAVICLLCVLIGAFGAHMLKPILSTEMLTVYDTAIRYQMFHGIGLLVLGLLMTQTGASNIQLKRYAISAGLFLLGLLLFCGSLYALALSGIKVLGAITPFGGLAFILGWFYLAISVKDL